jgi:hypothetical protein
MMERQGHSITVPRVILAIVPQMSLGTKPGQNRWTIRISGQRFHQGALKSLQITILSCIIRLGRELSSLENFSLENLVRRSND